MNKLNFQEKQWAGEFGDAYLGRNPKSIREEEDSCLKIFGVTRTDLVKEFINKLDRSAKILEVGCNAGVQLMILQKMGFKNLYGIEINIRTLNVARSLTKDINLVQGTALDLPFKDNYFDLVFTSGVLVHIAPSNVKKAMKEIYRCAKNYIWGFESYDDKLTEVVYRGNKNMIWKTNFSKLYLDSFKDLKLVKEKKVKYKTEKGEIDLMFLLKKNGKKKP